MYRSDIGEPLIGSHGLHLYLLILDGSDAERALRSLHDRCVLNGLGWLMVGAAGQLLERSIIDRTVHAPDDFFEGPPILTPPLVQDFESRRPPGYTKECHSTADVAVPDLSIVEKERLKHIKAQTELGLAPKRLKARQLFISRQASGWSSRVLPRSWPAVRSSARR